MSGEWAHYWRSADQPLEAMHAHFERHVYHRHSHESYSFGVTDTGVQSFMCRGARHTSAAGMVMAFNPDDPHDGGPIDGVGFTYRMVHIAPEVVTDVLGDGSDRPPALPLFAEPVVAVPELAARLRALHAALLGRATPLRRDELLAAAITSMVRRGSTSSGGREGSPPPGASRLARRTREVLRDRFMEDVSAADLAASVGASRFAVYRSFQSSYGLAPSDYQRQLRLRTARDLIRDGLPIAAVATATGFADQSHLTRWFVRTFGVTPGTYRAAS